MKTKRLHSTAGPDGFTLLELLVTIGIIAVLASVAMPGIQSAMMSGRANAAMRQGREISLGLTAYAMDYNGRFPDGQNTYGQEISNSNAAFRSLRDYIEDERVFAVGGSAWGSDADNHRDGPGEFLQPGENHFAYIAGLNNTSTPYWPLVVDGTDGSGTYNRNDGQRGGTWKGKRAIVVRVDGSASVVPLRGDDNARFIPRLEEDDQNALVVESYMSRGARLLDPEG
jgi:prepilin-type N-terminal cleavage/methylation domain-containing protein